MRSKGNRCFGGAGTAAACSGREERAGAPGLQQAGAGLNRGSALVCAGLSLGGGGTPALPAEGAASSPPAGTSHQEPRPGSKPCGDSRIRLGRRGDTPNGQISRAHQVWRYWQTRGGARVFCRRAQCDRSIHACL